MKEVHTLTYHISHTDVSVASYIRAKRIELANTIANHHKIYLDTRYWVLFRDIVLGRNTSPVLKSLFSAIKEAVSEKKAICPLSQDIFTEVFTQKDPVTLKATVNLIDELSNGVCLTEFTERMNTEVYHLMIQKTLGDGSVYDLDQLMWTKCGYVLGYVAPKIPWCSEETSIAVEKAFFDQVWSVTLDDLLDLLGHLPDWQRKTETIVQMNDDKIKYQTDFNSFKQAFLIELRGILDTFEDAFSDIAEQMYFKEIKNSRSDSHSNNIFNGKTIANVIYHAFRLNKIKDELPTFRIHAKLHAALRWDRDRKYKFNDLADLRHASMALPYCDLFLTDGPLCHLMNQNYLKLNTTFRCRTISDTSEALEYLSEHCI